MGSPPIVDHVDDEPRILKLSKLARDLDVAVVLTDLATRGVHSGSRDYAI